MHSAPTLPCWSGNGISSANQERPVPLILQFQPLTLFSAVIRITSSTTLFCGQPCVCWWCSHAVQAPTLCVHPGCEYSRKSSMKKWQNCNYSFSTECGGTPAGGESAVHNLMDAMSSAQKLRGAGLTPHFHAERSSNGSCGGPPPVRSSPGMWKNPRRLLMSHFHSVLQSVPLWRSVHGPVAR